ncbi:MAG: TlpA family protein disulfide reductase [Actinomycetota bacterium]
MSIEAEAPAAPELSVGRWFNTAGPLTLAGLRGSVVAIEAFQMLCPGCVSHGLPQAQRLARTFGDDLTVLGLHTVFEHHAAMTPVALEAFLHEYRIGFPVGVDRHEEGDPTPITMRRLGLRGTPSLVLVDRRGRMRANLFGNVDDLALGALVARLADEEAVGCDPATGCPVPLDTAGGMGD